MDDVLRQLPPSACEHDLHFMRSTYNQASVSRKSIRRCATVFLLLIMGSSPRALAQQSLRSRSSVDSNFDRSKIRIRKTNISSNSIHDEEPSQVKHLNIPTIKLQNRQQTDFPLVGIGVGNLPHKKIPSVVSHALDESNQINLIDTSRSSSNEALVARAVMRHGQSASHTTDGNIRGAIEASNARADYSDAPELPVSPVHVVTKVWYTHLGYERTSLSVKDSLSEFQSVLSPSSGVDARVHVLLQYPYCDDSISWQNCQKEENSLDTHTKSIGPDPTLNKRGAWKESWRALEDMYSDHQIESIGISNFGSSELNELFDIAQVKPHIYQASLRQVVLDTDLNDVLKREGVHVQVYNAVQSILDNVNKSPRAFKALERIGASYHQSIDAPGVSKNNFSAIHVVLAWLVQRGFGIVPGSSNFDHMTENSPEAITQFPKLIPRHSVDVETAISSLLRGVDLEEEESDNLGKDFNEGVVATFFNAMAQSLKIFVVDPKSGRQVPVSRYIEAGKSNRIIANPNDVFVVYDLNGSVVKRYRITERHGGEEEFSMEL